MLSIGFLGECMIEFISGRQSSYDGNYGGDTYNTAVYISRLNKNNTIKSYYISAVGKDMLSNSMLENWKSEGIDTNMSIQLDGRTVGSYKISTLDNGERNFTYNRNQSAAKFYFSRTSTPLETALNNGQLDYLYLSGISLAILPIESRQRLINIIKQFKINSGKIIFDNNFRPTLWQ